jgi:predicted DNA-binding ribbon-helix-helix protein
MRVKSSLIVKHSIVTAGHKTGVSVEDAFWKGLKEIARGRNMTLSDLVTTINSKRKHSNLSSAIRLFVLDHYRRQAVALLRKRSAVCPADFQIMVSSSSSSIVVTVDLEANMRKVWARTTPVSVPGGRNLPCILNDRSRPRRLARWAAQRMVSKSPAPR